MAPDRGDAAARAAGGRVPAPLDAPFDARPTPRALFPGVMACGVVAAAATFLSEHYAAPVTLFALLLGLGVTLGQIAELGWWPLVIVGFTPAVPRRAEELVRAVQADHQRAGAILRSLGVTPT